MSDSVPARQPAVNVTRTPAGDAFSALVVAVLRLAATLEAAGNDLARPAGQTAARWQVLAVAEHAPATVAAVARALGLARQSVQRVADVLVRDGLATYEDNPAHQRAKLLRLTPPGAAALVAIQRRQAVWADTVAAGLDGERLDAAHAVLREVQARLSAADEPG